MCYAADDCFLFLFFYKFNGLIYNTYLTRNNRLTSRYPFIPYSDLGLVRILWHFNYKRIQSLQRIVHEITIIIPMFIYILSLDIFSLLGIDTYYLMESTRVGTSGTNLLVPWRESSPVLEGRPIPWRDLSTILEGSPIPWSETSHVLEGRPILGEHEWEAISSPFYLASVVHIAGGNRGPPHR